MYPRMASHELYSHDDFELGMCVFASVHVNIYVVCVYVCLEGRDQCPLSYSVALHLIFGGDKDSH